MKKGKMMIIFQEIEFGYEQKETILKNIHLSINQGESVGIIGANGAGKSTLLKLLVGLEKPTKGKITVNNVEVTKKNIKKIRKSVGYTFQDADHQLFMPTVYDDVAFSMRQEKVKEEIIYDRVMEVLKDVGAEHLAKKAPYKMSGGEKRLATLATALVTKPDIIVLDEPTIGLDPKARRQLIEQLKTRKETKLIATHDMDMALEICD